MYYLKTAVQSRTREEGGSFCGPVRSAKCNSAGEENSASRPGEGRGGRGGGYWEDSNLNSLLLQLHVSFRDER